MTRRAGTRFDDEDATRRSVHGRRRPWSRLGPQLLIAVMLPVVALSALGVVGVAQRFRDAGAVSGVATQVERVTRTLHLYAGLVGEKTGSESIVVASALHISPARAGRLAGFDIEAQLRSARASVDAGIADGAGTILGKKVPELLGLRARIDARTASETAVRSFFIEGIHVAESAWLAQLSELTQTSFATVGSGEIRRSIAGLADAVDAFISGTKETTPCRTHPTALGRGRGREHRGNRPDIPTGSDLPGPPPASGRRRGCRHPSSCA